MGDESSRVERVVPSRAVARIAFLVGLGVLLSACATSLKQARDLRLCVEGQCESASKGRFTKEEVVAGLFQMLKQNEDTDIQICEANPQTRECVDDVTYFWMGGPLPLMGTVHALRYQNVSLHRRALELKYQAKYRNTTAGVPVVCELADTTLSLPSMNEVSIESPRFYCNWAGVGHSLASFHFSMDFVDFDRSILGGRYALRGGGFLNVGGGSGYLVLQFKKQRTLAQKNVVPIVEWQAPAAESSAPQVTSVPPARKAANRWSVIIGIGEYEAPAIPRLRYAVRDAEAMYEFLTGEAGYAKDQVLLLTDKTENKPTLLNIKRALGDFLARRAGRDDMVLIYFAGHGAPEIDVAGTESDGLSKYLVPRDGDPESLYTTALPMDEIQRIFARIQAERVVLLLDTCYSGTAGGRTFARQQTRSGGLNDQFLERLTRSRGRVIITASGPNEVALELPELGHGLFTYYVLEGLRGRADRNGDGVVTVSELYEYVEEGVDHKAREAGGRQRPLMKGEIEGTLPLSRVRK